MMFPARSGHSNLSKSGARSFGTKLSFSLIYLQKYRPYRDPISEILCIASPETHETRAYYFRDGFSRDRVWTYPGLVTYSSGRNFG